MLRLALSSLLLAALTLGLVAQDEEKPDPGVLPKGDDGKPLNLDFETGTLKDWTATGDAFKDQPVKGDTVHPRRNDMRSRHQGQYWIGTYERKRDVPKGTLTSVAFTVTHPYASFLVGGGPHESTCVELVTKDDNKVFHRASGLEEEDMRREVVDLRPYKGKKIYVRVVDNHTGHWGHVNFDDFRFHEKKPAFPSRPKPVQPDTYKHAGLRPKEAAAAMTVPEGFSVTLCAGEPDVRQPIALCLDDRGRVWVAEAYSYPVRRADKDAKDRIVIFEDTDGDGAFDKRTVFMEGLNLVSGLEVGFGGVWIGAAPYLLFVPVKEGEDKPAGKAQILLDGWGYQDTHETLNTFSWGPDGWLYGCHGVFTHSLVGKPKTPKDKRVQINAGVWRYHPTRHEFEVFAHGTSNPWGLDFNDYGQAFCEACVIPHNWHVIQGGRYHRQGGQHFNTHTYADLQTIAKHRHYVEGANVWAVNDRSSSAGGGHAHCGTMIYLGGTWPAKYRGQMFMGNVHGRRLNVDVLARKGSGYEADRSPDFLLANDAYARFINLRYGPDGNVYLIDWYDKQACHHHDIKITDRETGRIYKIAHKDAKSVKVDLRQAKDDELVKHQLNDNDWYVRHARRILQERGGNREVYEALQKIAFDHKDETRRVRGLWALHATGGLTTEHVTKALADRGTYVRAWAVQLATEKGRPSDELLKSFAEMARKDDSPVVRLYLASACQRLPLADRWAILEGLVSHKEDATDHNLPLMYWYAAEPLADEDAGKALALASKAETANLLPFLSRRVASLGTPKALAAVVEQLNKEKHSSGRRAVLRGMQEGLAGQRNVPAPEGWKDVAVKLVAGDDEEVRSRVIALGVVFGDRRAFAALRQTLQDDKAELPSRRQALAGLVEARDKEVVPILHTLTKHAELRGDAIRALASFDDAKTPALLLELYPALDGANKRAAVATLASRASYGKALLSAVEKKQVPAADVPADLIRNLRNLGDADLDAQIVKAWGVFRTTPKERLALIKQTKGKLAKPTQPPDVALGRTLYTKTCAQCHTLFGVGGKVGPDITGANRSSVDYLLENVLDPSAVIPKEYAATILTLESGRKITGIVRAETEKTLTVVTAEETLTIRAKDVEKRETSPLSMMPDDLLKALSEHEVASLFAYLRSPTQTGFLATADNAKDLFNGKDLTGWVGDPKLWKVENGEIVGKTAGLKRNEFLRSELIATDFELTLKVKLVPDKENSGVQFRSDPLEGGEMRGPQADVGAGWWGKLYEEQGRGLLWKESGEKHVKAGDWNVYRIRAVGGKVQTWINGEPCVDLEDDKLSRRGHFGLQLHSGGAMEVRYKELKLEVIAAKK